MRTLLKEIVDNTIKKSPRSVTILPTYKCNAACENCCFESNPRIKTKMNKDEIISIIASIKDELPGVDLIVFSGGEATLLNKELFESIGYASSLGYATRLVSNGFWGKTKKSAESIAKSLFEAGLSELNLSTGDEHREFIPLNSVVQAAYAMVSYHVTTLITIEGAKESNIKAKDIQNHPLVKIIHSKPIYKNKLQIITNIWMEFKRDSSFKDSNDGQRQPNKGCDNIINNLAINPYGRIYSCCGLTMEYIDELIIGTIKDTKGIGDAYNDQFKNLLKLWIWLDGPHAIIESINETPLINEIQSKKHACEVCLSLHKEEVIRAEVSKQLEKKKDSIIIRALMKAKQEKILVDNV